MHKGLNGGGGGGVIGRICSRIAGRVVVVGSGRRRIRSRGGGVGCRRGCVGGGRRRVGSGMMGGVGGRVSVGSGRRRVGGRVGIGSGGVGSGRGVGRSRGIGSGGIGVGGGMAVVILPGVEVDLGDGDGVAGHDGVAEIVKFVSNIF